MSYKTERLIVISLFVIILAVAANDSTTGKETTAIAYTKRVNDSSPQPVNEMSSSVIDPALFVLPKVTVKTLTQNSPKNEAKLENEVKPATIPPKVPSNSSISAEAYLVADLNSGEMYIKNNSRAVFPIASLSKLMTAIIVLHKMDLAQKVTITDEMLLPYGDAGHLSRGETFAVSELLYPLLMESSNDAADALARSYGYGEFIKQMNDFAAGLRMVSTSFKDPSGLSGENISSAEDLFILAKYIYQNEKNLLDITKNTTITLDGTDDRNGHIFRSINPFTADPHFMGGKTGRTNEAKESMITLFRYERGSISYPLVVIVLRSDFNAREVNTSLLLRQFIDKVSANSGE